MHLVTISKKSERLDAPAGTIRQVVDRASGHLRANPGSSAYTILEPECKHAQQSTHSAAKAELAG